MKQYNICDRAASGKVYNNGTMFIGEACEIQKLMKLLASEADYEISHKPDDFNMEKMYGLWVDELYKKLYMFNSDTTLRFLVSMDI